MLGFYVQHFDTVELNNTFYQLPKEQSLSAWRDATPPGFTFAVKGSRFLTHMKKLKDAEMGLTRFLEPLETLGNKLGPILFQLPPKWQVDTERFHKFLSILPKLHSYAFEFREPTWESEPVYELLRRHRAAHCAFHLAGYQSPVHITTDFTYVRLHGPGGKYQGSYSDEELRGWAKRIGEWIGSGLSAWVYFDNDDSGYAAKNAARLRELLEQR